MASPLSAVLEILEMMKSQDAVFTDDKISDTFCKFGVIQASIALKKDFPVKEIKTVDELENEISSFIIDAPISDKEIYLSGIYAYRNFAIKQHDELMKKAINFKTISFAVSGLTERAKEAMRIVWWCDSEILRVLRDLAPTVGIAAQMGGE